MHDASKGFTWPATCARTRRTCASSRWPPRNGSGSRPKLAASREPDPEKLIRVRMGHLPVRYACLGRWESLRKECREQNATWPWPESRKALAGTFREVCQGVPGKDWTQVRVLNEGGRQVDDFLKGFAEDPAEAK